MGNKNTNLQKAKLCKNDEFYTRYEDIEKEISHYKSSFKNKIVLCNCDDPFESNFCKFFLKNFNVLKLKRLICTSFGSSKILSTELKLLDENNDKLSKKNGYVLDVIKFFFGTKYDNIKKYIEKYKEDGIIWYFDCFEMSTPELYRILWQMKNSDYFKYCSGIIFGRPVFIREDYNISFNQAILDVLSDLNIPIICDADIGHRKPQFAIVNGAILNIISENGKGIIKTYFKN